MTNKKTAQGIGPFGGDNGAGAAVIVSDCTITPHPVQALLDQATQRIKSDPARADKHRRIYLALWPLAFADRLTDND